ncbi:MAG: sugar phosphate isomerase/epimerase family protein [Phycisphaeraceae bacterium]
MIHSAITLSLVPESRGGPFVFWDDLPAACKKAAALGYDAIEIFAPGPDTIDTNEVTKITGDLGLKVAAVGTGAGWVKHKLHLTLPDKTARAKAMDFIGQMIDVGAQFKAPAIIGSMQGRWGDSVSRDMATGWLGEALNKLGEHAKQYSQPVIYEPLNRYETNMVNTIAGGIELIRSLDTTNVKLLADLFHMNIEETNIAAALREGKGHIGHVHFVDSNRRPAGNGHMDYAPIAAALKEIDYNGYASAEAFPWPDPDAAAKQTISMFNKLFA